jgi:transcriptional regulator with XRE-family HTH domain
VSPIESANPALADTIRALREDRDLTQEDVAYAAGITPGALSRVECAKTNPTWTTVERIAQALDVSMEQLAAATDRRR